MVGEFIVGVIVFILFFVSIFNLADNKKWIRVWFLLLSLGLLALWALGLNVTGEPSAQSKMLAILYFSLKQLVRLVFIAGFAMCFILLFRESNSWVRLLGQSLCVILILMMVNAIYNWLTVFVPILF